MGETLMNKKIIKTLICILINFVFNMTMLTGTNLVSHEMKFQHITQKNGLSQGSIMSIIQDKNGFMWFGTQSGLNKYDGYEFEVFLNDPDDQF